jgi:hypothetical protein
MSATCGARCEKFARRVLRGGKGTSGLNRKTCPYPPLGQPEMARPIPGASD